MDLSGLAKSSAEATTPSTTTTTTTTISTPTDDAKSAALLDNMNDFWLQMQKLFKPGQILMKDKDGVKLNNVLISSQEDYEDDEEEYDYDYELEGQGTGLSMDLHSVAPALDLRDLIRGKKKVERVNRHQFLLDSLSEI